MTARTPIQSIVAFAGVVFLAAGILGFVPGITTHYGDLGLAGHSSRAELLGVFQVSVLHNIVQLLYGAAALALAKSAEGARTFLLAGGVVYLGLWVLGIVGGGDWIPVNTADDWLHFVVGIAMVGATFVLSRPSSPRTAPA
jgi:uncharacterized protein DUF4383